MKHPSSAPTRALLICCALALAACGAAPGPDEGYGANPKLGAPDPNGPIPTLNAARAVGWAEDASPTAANGFAVARYAEGVTHPRWLYLLPNGDVLVAQSATRAGTGGGITGWVRRNMQRSAGAYEEEGTVDRITLLRDSDGDGDVDETHLFKEGLNQPFGMALIGNVLFIANTNEVLRFDYTPGASSLSGDGQRIAELPYREEGNGHWTRGLAVSPDQTKLYVTVGSVSNIADSGMEVEEGRAAVWEMNPDGSDARVYATGLRNPVGIDFEPVTGAVWVAVNERDMLGDNLVPDYFTSVRDGHFYGWPFYYYGDNRDERVEIPANVRLRAPTAPDYALGSHTASLGLHFYRGQALPARFHGGAFIGQHGSWNRRAPAGYKVVFVPFANGSPAGEVEDFLTGFLDSRGRAQGRPVGVIADRTGAILVADDVGDIIWRVAPAG